MAMLAGPRRKQTVINLRAKANEWTNDKSKFGQKMLEKMGWSEGKGLGANENGIVEHVIARYKNDEKGLGFVDKNDQWTKHEDDFNALLANLSNATTDDVQYSAKSLEKKSKSSKARIHYQKYTRGKDLSRYSEKDLANIFGKKKLNNNDTVKTKQVVTEEEPSASSSSGQVFTEKGNMNDYFKNKLAALKSISLKDNSNPSEDMVDYSFQGFSSTNNIELDIESTVFDADGYHANQSRNMVSNIDDIISINKNDIEKKSKRNKSKSKIKINEVKNKTESGNEMSMESVTKSKSKKRKRKNGNDLTDISNELNTEENESELRDSGYVKSSEKKKVNCSDEDTKETKSKKKKKSKHKDLLPSCGTDNRNALESCVEGMDYVKDNVGEVLRKKKKREKLSQKCDDQKSILDKEEHLKRKKKKNKL